MEITENRKCVTTTESVEQPTTNNSCSIFKVSTCFNWEHLIYFSYGILRNFLSTFFSDPGCGALTAVHCFGQFGMMEPYSLPGP